MDAISVNSLPPVGLLGLFQVKTDGATPRPMKELQWTFDCTEYFVRGSEQIIKGDAVAVANAVGVTLLTVGGIAMAPPNGKAWLLTGLTGVCVTTVTDYRRGRIVAFEGQSAANTYIALTDETASKAGAAAAGVGAALAAMRAQDRPVLIRPGNQLAWITLETIGAGAVTVTPTARLIEFPY